MLHLAGYPVVVIYMGNREKASEEFHCQVDIAECLGVSIIAYQDFIPGRCDVLVDAIFGVGLSRPVEGEMLSFFAMLKEAAPRLTVAVDLPSGISSDNGFISGKGLQRKSCGGGYWLSSIVYDGKPLCLYLWFRRFKSASPSTGVCQ